MKLVQKCFMRESREYEIIDDEFLNVRIKGLLKEEKSSVSLSLLNPEPVLNGSELEFYSNYKGHPVLSLLLNKPNKKEFNQFIDQLKQIIKSEDSQSNTMIEHSQEKKSEAFARNVYEEPPEFPQTDSTKEKKPFKPVISKRLAEDIMMLKTYLENEDINDLLASLEKLESEPDNEAAYNEMIDIFNGLGFMQGPVITYATYLKVLVSNHVSGKGLE